MQGVSTVFPGYLLSKMLESNGSNCTKEAAHCKEHKTLEADPLGLWMY